MKKIVPILIIVIMCIISTVTYAVDVTKITQKQYTSPEDGRVKSIAGNILGVIEIIGVAVATIMLIFVAIKYMMSAASDKAEVKKYLIPYLVGAIFMFGSSGIVEIIRQAANQTLNK